jgi:predicted Zn-dependent protease
MERNGANAPVHRGHETGCVLTADLGFGERQPCLRTTHFEACREERASGTVVCRSAAPPRAWGVPEAAPPETPATAPVAQRLQQFAVALGAAASLRYSRLLSLRHVTDAAGDWRARTVDVFALTGCIRLADGRLMSLGWSGSGDGLRRMAEGPMRERVAWIARQAGTAEPADAGATAAVLAPQAAAVVAHEAVGHFAEAAADPGVDLRHRLGCRLAADGFDAFDDPTLPAAARYGVDDEGTVPIGATRMLEDGVLVQQLHSRRSADAARTLPTANARAAQIGQAPIPRLSNLVVPAGTQSQAELVDAMGSGLLVHHLSHGYSRGIDIEARIVLAERVSHGRPTGRFVSGGRISERVDVLTRCVGRGAESELNPNALCGKHGQILYDVGTVAPAMRLTSLRIAA